VKGYGGCEKSNLTQCSGMVKELVERVSDVFYLHTNIIDYIQKQKNNNKQTNKMIDVFPY